MSNWKHITNESQLNDLIELSYINPVVIFKHSTRCGISNQVKDGLEAEWAVFPSQAQFFYLDLLTFRSISNLIAEKFGVVHQSPQVIILEDGKPVYDSSHFSITPESVNLVLNRVIQA